MTGCTGTMGYSSIRPTIHRRPVLGVDHDTRKYPDAGHAFLNDHEGAGDRNRLIFVGNGDVRRPSGYHDRR